MTKRVTVSIQATVILISNNNRPIDVLSDMIQKSVDQMGQMMPHGDTSGNSALLWIIIILLVIIIAYLWFTGGRRQPIKATPVQETPINESQSIETDKIDVALRLLNDHEKQIVQALIDKGGEMLQKDISSELDLTRVQTHRAIQSLIERDIVSAEDHFNTKKITLRDWLTQ